MNPLLRSSLFSGINKYLLLCLLAFLLVLGYLLLTNSVNPLKQTAPISPPQTGQTPTMALPAPKELAAQNSPEVPLNKLLYDQVKSQLKSGEQLISSGRLHGKIISKKTQNGKLIIEIESYVPTMKHKTVWYVYDASWIPKIKVLEGKKTLHSITFEQIVPGAEVFIDEKDDYSKDFPESIIGITITKITAN